MVSLRLLRFLKVSFGLHAERLAMAKAMAKVPQGSDDLVVVIRADRKTPHEAVVRAMDVARRLGLVRITFSTQKPRNAD